MFLTLILALVQFELTIFASTIKITITVNSD